MMCVMDDSRMDTELKAQMYGLDWRQIMKRAIESRKTSWNDNPIASDEVCSAVIHEMESKGIVPTCKEIIENDLKEMNKVKENKTCLIVEDNGRYTAGYFDVTDSVECILGVKVNELVKRFKTKLLTSETSGLSTGCEKEVLRIVDEIFSKEGKEKMNNKQEGKEQQTKITFEMESEQCVNIMSGGKKVGHIFSPSSSGNDVTNAIQVCGFSEAFELWGCGIFKGFKDIQLLFDDKAMEGVHHFNLSKCCRCYMEPCQCENKIDIELSDDVREEVNCGGLNKKFGMPFNVKSTKDLKDRLEFVKKDVQGVKKK